MAALKTVKILNDELLDRVGDFAERLYTVALVDSELVGTPEEAAATIQLALTVKASRSLQSTWSLTDDQLRPVMYEYAKRFLSEKVSSGEASASLSLDLNTSTAPLKCPFDLTRIKIDLGQAFQVQIARPLGFRRGK